MKPYESNHQAVDLYVCTEIEEVLEQELNNVVGVNRRIYKNQLLFILSRIHWKQSHHPNDYRDNGARLRIYANTKMLSINPDSKKGTLVWYLGSKGGKVSNQVQSLIEWGIISSFKEPKPNVTARTYKLANRFSDARLIKKRFTPKDGAFVKRLLEERREKIESSLVKSILNIYQQHVSISEEGLEYLESKYWNFPIVTDVANAHRSGLFDDNMEELSIELKKVPVDVVDQRLWMLFEKYHYASIGKRNGRLDHNLTNLDSEFRQFVLINGQPMHSTDIVNSQPTFSIPVILKKLQELQGASFIIPPDMHYYKQCCIEGIFYEVIADKAGIDIGTKDCRNHFKQNILYPEVLYCRNNNWNTRTQVAFRSLFPNADKAIRDLKSRNHNNFSIELQRLESDLMINTVFTQLINEGFIVLPLHDAIYCSCRNTKSYAEKLIRNAFHQKYNLTVAFKGEDVTEFRIAA